MLIITCLNSTNLFKLEVENNSASDTINANGTDGVIILEYHTVTDTPDVDSVQYNVKPSDFSAQLDYLHELGYNTITTLEYMKAVRGKLTLPENPIILTFDDGYENNYTEMLPILEAHGMKAVVYVITNEIGKPGYLNVEQLRQMQRRGVEIGSHTANHRPLIGLSRVELEHEIGDSKTFLEWNGIDTVYSLSYPNGAYEDKVVEVLKSKNYLTAVTGDAGLNVFDTDPFKLQRVNIPQPHFGLFEFKMRLLKANLLTKLGINQHRQLKLDKTKNN